MPSRPMKPVPIGKFCRRESWPRFAGIFGRRLAEELEERNSVRPRFVRIDARAAINLESKNSRAISPVFQSPFFSWSESPPAVVRA